MKDSLFKNVEKKTNINKDTIMSLAKKLQSSNFKDEKVLNEVIDELSSLTGKNIDDSKRDKIIKAIKNDKVPSDIENKWQVTMKKCAVIINPKSGDSKGIREVKKIETIIENYNYDVKIILTEYRGHAKEIMKNLEISSMLLMIKRGYNIYSLNNETIIQMLSLGLIEIVNEMDAMMIFKFDEDI